MGALERPRNGGRPRRDGDREEVGNRDTEVEARTDCMVYRTIWNLQILKTYLTILSCHQHNSRCFHECFLPGTWFEIPVLWGVGRC